MEFLCLQLLLFGISHSRPPLKVKQNRREQEKIMTEDQPIVASNSLTCLSPSIKLIPRELPASQFAVSKEKVQYQLRDIVPANQFNLSLKQNQNFSIINQKDKFFFSIREGSHKNSTDHVNGTSDDKRTRPEDIVQPHLVELPKKPKLVNKVSDCVLAARENCCKQTFLSSCSKLEDESFDREKKIANLVNPINLCKDQAATSISKKESVLKKEDQSCLTTHEEKLSRGFVFLEQVQEKLSGEEYNEFVGLMRALKSKTMKIASVLQSIAMLFSAPGRLSLLKGFKNFVPEKYQPLYEQHLKTHLIGDGN